MADRVAPHPGKATNSLDYLPGAMGDGLHLGYVTTTLMGALGWPSPASLTAATVICTVAPAGRLSITSCVPCVFCTFTGFGSVPVICR